MKYLIDFLEQKDISKALIFKDLKCSSEEALVLRALFKSFISGREEVVVADLLIELYGEENYSYLAKLQEVKNLLDLGWIVQQSFHQIKTEDMSHLNLLNSTITPTLSLIKLVEEGNLEFALPEVKPYEDQLEYLQDMFYKIELYQKISTAKNSSFDNNINVNNVKNKLELLSKRIEDRLNVTEIEISLEKFMAQKKMDGREQIIFLALLKEEYSAGENNLRDMNSLIDLISDDNYDKIKNRALLEENSHLLVEGIIDYEEVLNPFGGISRSFYIVDDVLQNIIHPQKKKRVQRLKLNTLIKEQDIFELVEPKTDLDDVVLNDKTRETLEDLLKQVDKEVVAKLHAWGIKDKKKGVDAKIIFYGPAGTGKTLTAHSLSKSLKKQVLSFDCSKILSMYVGESEKNVRRIFDTYEDLCTKSKTEPVLLLNEADQFLGARGSVNGSADQMHNQMQNIFLEQIENFEGILIATTNLLENIDRAFSRRFNYKIEFKKPNAEQRLKLWEILLPKNAPYGKNFSIQDLGKYDLTGGQIYIIVKNTAYKVATSENPEFNTQDFINEIEREKAGNFDSEKSVGFIN